VGGDSGLGAGESVSRVFGSERNGDAICGRGELQSGRRAHSAVTAAFRAEQVAEESGVNAAQLSQDARVVRRRVASRGEADMVANRQRLKQY
jgi:hypothetical protein